MFLLFFFTHILLAENKTQLVVELFKTNQKKTHTLTCNNLQPFLSNSFRSFAATPYFLFSLRLLILTGLFFPKSPNIALLFSVCNDRFLLLPREADYPARGVLPPSSVAIVY